MINFLNQSCVKNEQIQVIMEKGHFMNSGVFCKQNKYSPDILDGFFVVLKREPNLIYYKFHTIYILDSIIWMQVRPAPAKPKYKIHDYALPGNHPTNKMIFTNQPKTTQLECICR